MKELDERNLREQKNKTILIVEDDPINARVFQKILFVCLAHLYKPAKTAPSYVIKKLDRWYEENIVKVKPELTLDVICTEDVEEVIQFAESGKVNLILMDVSLGHSVYQGNSMDGIKITKMLKDNALTTNIPVVLVTAHAMEGDREKFLRESGADYYISKPVVDHQIFADFANCFLNKNNHTLTKMNQQMPDKNSQDNNNDFLIRNSRENNIPAKPYISTKTQKLVGTLLNSKSLKNKKDDVRDEYKIVCGSVAHSLKGEFMNIGSSIQEIRELANDSSEIQEECELMYRSLEYSQILLRQLLDYLDIGKPSVEPIAVLELIRKTELLARPRLPSNIELNVKVDSNLPNQMVLGNFEQLMSVLLELIKNATKVLRQQGGKIEIIIEMTDDDMAISVKDNGTGISEEVKDKLLKETVQSKSGLGLGLFVSNKVINELGGKLELHSSSEKGTKVTILMPIANEANL